MTWTQRLQLESLLKLKTPVKEICKILGVSNSTIYREIKRGEYKRINGATWEYYTAYSPDIAQEKYLVNLSGKGAPLKIGKDFEFADYIEKRIGKDKMSPCAVLGEIKHKNMKFETSICPATLYNYIANVGYSWGIIRVGSLLPTRFSFSHAILMRFNPNRIVAN